MIKKVSSHSRNVVMGHLFLSRTIVLNLYVYNYKYYFLDMGTYICYNIIEVIFYERATVKRCDQYVQSDTQEWR